MKGSMTTMLGTAAGAIMASAMVTADAAAQDIGPGLDIGAIESAPFPSQLTPAPRDGRLAWVYNEKGSRGVWIAERQQGDRFEVRKLTPWTGDDGVDIVDIAWAADARTVYFTRGGDGGGRAAVNPASSPDGVKAGEIWAVTLEGETRRIDDGVQAAPSPKGDIIAYLKGSAIWAAPADGSARPAPLVVDTGNPGTLRWSPDGAKLAFVSVRGTTHSIVGVYDVATKGLRWMAPGIDKDRAPAWSRDGRRIAFLRVATDGDRRHFYANRTGYPWEIWLADAATGSGSRLWRAAPGIGSRFRELLLSDPVQWAGDNRIVFPWEAGGWLRLYSLATDGGTPMPLSAEGAEVFNLTMSPDGKRAIYASNAGDLNRRHLWEVPVTGGRPVQLTHSRGVEDQPAFSSDGRLVALRGEARHPLRPVMIGASAMADIAPKAVPAEFPAAGLVEPEYVTFKASDGKDVPGQLFLPRNASGKRPAILFFHGGPTNRQMFASWDPFETHNHLYASCQYLASQGYIVLSLNYRGGNGYGLEHREPEGFGAGGASELRDIVGAAEYLKARSDVDPARLGVWGGSYGGRMASLALAGAPEYFAAGVDYAGVHNWQTFPGLQMGKGGEQLAYDSSAIARADKWRAPVLLMQPDTDRSVPMEQVTSLAAALRSHGVEVEQHMLPNETHFLLRHQSWITVFEKMSEFLGRKLGGKADPGAP